MTAQRPFMSSFLVSVRSRAEAQIALDNGATWIDIKEPRRGALGAADPSIWSQIDQYLGGQIPLSIALGELACPKCNGAAISRMIDAAPAGAMIKIGLAGCRRDGCRGEGAWPSKWRKVIDRAPETVQVAAVIYADWRQAQAPSPLSVLADTEHPRRRAVLIDTFQKQMGGIFRHTDFSALKAVVAKIHRLGLLAAVGGSLRLTDILPVRNAGADIIAMRGSLCADGRAGELDPDRIRKTAAQFCR